MFRKYEKTKRIDVPQATIKGKFFLCNKEVQKMLDGQITIEEKLDGANTGIIRHKRGYHLQKRGSLMGTGEHDQFTFMGNWARYNEGKLLEIPMNWIVYTELMFARHLIHYDMLPSYVIVIDIWNGKKYIDRYEKEKFCSKLGLQIVPLLHYGYGTKSGLFHYTCEKSKFSSSDSMEGAVIKNYKKQMRGKIVRPEFMKGVEESDHWVKHAVKRNNLVEGANWYD
jgi:hypothetical protein